MKKVLVSAVFVLAFAGSAVAGNIMTPEYGFFGPFPQTARSECTITYMNYCSGWVYTWTGYNGTEFADLQSLQRPPAKIGVCFDMDDCTLGCNECQHLEGLSWAWKRYTSYGRIDVEVFCANAECCPVGPALASVYDYNVDPVTAFQYIPLDLVELHCPSCKFVVIATVKTPEDCAPYSDGNDRNVKNGCEPDWRCTGHSYVYTCMNDYCGIYGYPARMLIEQPDACGYLGGFYVEWLCVAYVGCNGPTATEDNTWSQIKAFYR